MMKLKKTERYDAGYSREGFLKKFAIGALGAAMLGGLTGCRQDMSYTGDVPYQDPDGNSSCVSESDTKSGGQLPYEGRIMVESADEGNDEPYLLDGDVAYVPQDAADEG